MMKAVAYERVSYSEQLRGFSLETQRHAREEYAAKHRIDIVAAFVKQESAFTPGRTVFAEMVAFLETHPEVKTILVYNSDRLARNMYDHGLIVDKLGIRIISITEDLPENSSGRFILDTLAAGARFRSAQNGEKASAGMLTKARSSVYPTYAPNGYVNADRNIEIDPVVGPMLREMLLRYVRTDTSILDLSKWAWERGIRSRHGNRMSKSAVHEILKNPVYMGQFRWQGKVYDGSHEPLISVETFNAIQLKLHRRNLPRPAKRHFPYRGLVTCGYCGCLLTAVLKKGKYVYYHCTQSKGKCEQPYYSQDKLSVRLLEVLEGIRMTRENSSELMHLVTQDTEEIRRVRQSRRLQLKSEETRIIERMDSMYEDRLDGIISEDQWLRRDGLQNSRLRMVREEISRTSGETVFDEEAVRTTLELAQRLPELYLRKSHEERALALKIVSWNSSLTAESIDPVYKEPFAAIAKWRRSPDWLPG